MSRIASLYKLGLLLLLLAAPILAASKVYAPQLGPAPVLVLDALVFFETLVAVAYFQAWRRSVFTLLVSLLLLIGVAGVFNSNIPSYAIAYEGVRKSLFLFMAILIGIARWRDIDRYLIPWLAITLFIYSLYGVKPEALNNSFDSALIEAQTSGQYTFKIRGEQRAGSVFSSPFTFGMAGLLLYVLCEHMYRQKRIPWAMHLIAGAVAIGGVVASGTRTTLIVFAALIAYFHMRMLLILLVPLSVAVGIYAETQFKSGEIDRFVGMYVTDDRFTTRGDSYTEAMSAFRGSPSAYLIGFGSGSAGDTLSTKYIEQSYISLTSHNIFLKYLFEYGIPGLVVCCLVFIVAWRDARTSETGTQLLRPLLILLILCGLSFSAVEAWPVGVYIGLVIGCAYQMNKAESETDDAA